MSQTNDGNSKLVRVVSIQEIRAIPGFENFSDDQIQDIVSEIKEISLLINQIASKQEISE